MRKNLSKLLFILIFSSFCLLTSVKPAQASVFDSVGNWFRSVFSAQEASETYLDALEGGNVSGQVHTSETGTNLIMWLNTQNLGGGAVAQMAGLSEEEVKLAEARFGRGAMGAVTDGLVAMYTPPASTQTYVADLLESAHIIPEAQAQGLGFASLDPILEGWKQFRNIAYLFFVIIFMVIGFMIMFRAKVGQAAITAQQAIPSIIVSLIFVTFSYAIAGLMIDLMYLFMYMIAGMLSGGTDIIERNMFGIAFMLFGEGWESAQQGVEQLMEDMLNMGALTEALSWLSSLAAATIVGLAILFSVFKVFFELLKSYIAIILQIVFSPIILMMGAIPGQNTFLTWIKNLAGNLILWPVVLICILVERMLTEPIRQLDNAALNEAFGGGFMPPFLLGQGQAAVVPVLVGVGVLLVIPEIMQQVKKAMGVSDGIFGDLAKAGLNRIKSGEIAIPAVSGITGGAIGGARGTANVLLDKESKLRREGLFRDGKLNQDALKSSWQTIKGGFDVDGEMRGGIVNQGRQGFDWGKRRRVQIDRALSGNLLEAETVEKYLEGLASGGKKGKDGGGGDGGNDSGGGNAPTGIPDTP